MRALSCVLVSSLILSASSAAAQNRQVIAGNANAPFSAAVRADGLIYVAGTLSREGDITAQTKKVIEDLGATLQKAGSSLANVASVTVYLTKAADFAAMNAAYAPFWPKDPPVRTTVVADLVAPGALVEISMIAVPNGGERVVVHPEGWARSQNPYSYGIRSGDTLFLAGLVSRNGKDNAAVEGDMTVQAKTILANAGEILKAANFALTDVVASRVYITDVANFQAMNAAYQTAFTTAPPARATVVAPLMGPQYQVEMTFTAVRGTKEVITTPAADGTPGKPSNLLSSALKVGNRLYVSGILGNTAGNKGNAEAQTTEAMARIGRTLKAAGYDWADVVDSTVFLTDLQNFEAMNKGYRPLFPKEPPARATVRTGLVTGDGLVEIMFVAAK